MDSVHFIGVGGAGMSGIARILARQGVVVSGSDLRESPTLQSLRREFGIHAFAGHDAAHLNGAKTVVYSAAVKEDNPELASARARGLEVVERSEMLGRLMARYDRSIGITGTHGKTTTTGMVATMLDTAGYDPTVLIGGDLPAYGGNARLGESDVFVAEACEAYDSFLDMQPQVAIITNIDLDHLDYYDDLDHILRSFRTFLKQVPGLAIVNGDDPNVATLMEDRAGFPPFATYGFGDACAIRAANVALEGLQPSYDVVLNGTILGRITLGVPGRHNVLNSLAAVRVGLHMGLRFGQIASGLALFTGTGRRFEQVGVTAGGVLVVDDYAHHPTEIRATLAAARGAFPNRRIVAVFQPHLPSRTRDLRDDFAASFTDADQVVVTEIYLAREQPLAGVTGDLLAKRIGDRRGADRVTYVEDKSEIPQRLQTLAITQDVVITMGAGDIRSAGEAYLALSGKAAVE